LQGGPDGVVETEFHTAEQGQIVQRIVHDVVSHSRPVRPTSRAGKRPREAAGGKRGVMYVLGRAAAALLAGLLAGLGSC